MTLILIALAVAAPLVWGAARAQPSAVPIRIPRRSALDGARATRPGF